MAVPRGFQRGTFLISLKFSIIRHLNIHVDDLTYSFLSTENKGAYIVPIDFNRYFIKTLIDDALGNLRKFLYVFSFPP